MESSIWQILFGWGVLGTAAVVLIGIGFGVMSMTPPDFVIARICFTLAAAILVTKTAVWLVQLGAGKWECVSAAFLIFGIIGAAWVWSYTWVEHRESSLLSSQHQPVVTAAPKPDSDENKTPSLFFVIGAPLGDNQSEGWIMLIQHYGPNRAYGCNIEFFDRDRKNIEHEWLVKNPNTPFLPAGMFDASQLSMSIAEGGPEPSNVASFPWTPLDPNRQHYSVTISCRDGYFVENWEVTRIDDVLRAKVTIEHGPQWIQNHPNLSPVILHCQDQEFIPQPLLSEIPKKHAKVVHPGWKPNYRVEIPMAIIDPNGHIQVASGVGTPDGGTRTDFGCWNLLTKHFGDGQTK